MNIQITQRHETISTSVKEYLIAEIENLSKFSDHITSCNVVIEDQKLNCLAEITINAQGTTLNSKSHADNIGKAFDAALNKITRQLKKKNEKTKNHKTRKEDIEQI